MLIVLFRCSPRPLLGLLAMLSLVFTHCGGGSGSKTGTVTTAVTSVTASGTLNAPAGGFRGASVLTDWKVVAYSVDGATATGTFTETLPGQSAEFNIALDFGRVYRLLLVRNNALYATFGYPHATAGTTTTLPLTGTLTNTNQFALGTLTAPATAGGVLSVSAANNPLTKLKTAGGQLYSVATDSPAVDTTLAANLNTVFTATTAATLNLPPDTLPSTGDVNPGTDTGGGGGGGGATCSTTTPASATGIVLSPSAGIPGTTVQFSGAGLPTGTVYVTSFGANQSVIAGFSSGTGFTYKSATCADVQAAGVLASPIGGTSVTFALPQGVATGSINLVLIEPGKKAAPWTLPFTVQEPAVDNTAPTVVSTTPTGGSTVNASIASGSITFSEAMNTSLALGVTATLTNQSTGAVIFSGAHTTLGTVSWSTDARTLTFALLSSDPRRLDASTTYSFTFTLDPNTLKDTAGNAINLAGSTLTGVTLNGNTISGVFTTDGNGQDATPPTVASVTPANGSTVSALTRAGSVTFSEAMNTTLTSSVSIQLTNTSTGTMLFNNVASTALGNLTWSTDGKTATFTLTGDSYLVPGHAYAYLLTLDLATFKDAAGNSLDLQASGPNLGGANVLSSTIVQGTFSATTDATAPIITGTTPGNGATVTTAQNTGVISFSEPMNTALTPSITLTITNPTTGVAPNTNVLSSGNIVWATDARSLTYTLTDANLTLLANTTYNYTLTIDTATIKDLAGNNLNLPGSSLNSATVTLSSGTVYTVSGLFSAQ